MAIDLQPYNDEAEALIAFLTGETWPYHGVRTLTEANVREQVAQGRYDASDEKRTFWILDDKGTKVGLLRVFDLQDPTPMFDIRISAQYRGQGLGLLTVKRLVEYVFTNYADTIRLEGHTRVDNYAMRKTFHNAGFVKEAVHRLSWPSEDGELHDSIGYAMLREDWAENKTTPINWDDFPY